MLIKGELATDLKNFIKEVNKTEQANTEAAIDAFCNKIESVVYNAIRKATIIIPPAMIQVQGTPSAQTNGIAIVLNNVIK